MFKGFYNLTSAMLTQGRRLDIISNNMTNVSTAGFDETGLPLDFAIEGEGFFAVNTPTGRMYTRNGSFSLDNDGYLYLPGQGRVLDSDGEELQLGTDKLNGDGYGGLFNDNGGFYGRVGVFAFEDPGEQLEKNEQGMFVSNAQPQSVTSIVHPGMLERSNVDWVREMSEMIASQRAYQSAAQASKIYDQVMRQATEDVGRLV